jgi:hypothetical protein
LHEWDISPQSHKEHKAARGAPQTLNPKSEISNKFKTKNSNIKTNHVLNFEFELLDLFRISVLGFWISLEQKQ